MTPIEAVVATKGMKSYLAGTPTGMNFRTFVATLADTEITMVTGKYLGAPARQFTLTDFWPSGKKFGIGEFFSFGENFIITSVTIATGGGINTINLENITPTPAA